MWLAKAILNVTPARRSGNAQRTACSEASAAKPESLIVGRRPWLVRLRAALSVARELSS